MIKINTDAAFNPKTQASGIGIILQGSKDQQVKIHYTNVFDNHSAEFIALYEALTLVDLNDYDEFILYQADSKIVIDSLDKNFVKHEEYTKLLDKIMLITDKMPNFYFKWIPERQNKGADTLSRQALHLEGKVIKKEKFSL